MSPRADAPESFPPAADDDLVLEDWMEVEADDEG